MSYQPFPKPDRHDMRGWTQSDYDANVQVVAEIHKNNRARKAALYDQWTELLRLADRVYGAQSREYKYLRMRPVEDPPSARRELDRISKLWNVELARREQKLKASNRRERSKEAAKTLIDLGYTPGRHFGGNAITFLKRNAHQGDDGNWVRNVPKVVVAVPDPKRADGGWLVGTIVRLNSNHPQWRYVGVRARLMRFVETQGPHYPSFWYVESLEEEGEHFYTDAEVGEFDYPTPPPDPAREDGGFRPGDRVKILWHNEMLGARGQYAILDYFVEPNSDPGIWVAKFDGDLWDGVVIDLWPTDIELAPKDG